MLNKFLVGNNRINSHIDYKQAVLRGQLSILLGAVSLFYLIFDPINGLYTYMPFYTGAMAVSVAVIYLNRIRRHTTASIVLLTFTNLFVFLVADASRPDSGVYFFFADMTLVSLVLFYHNNLKLGIVFMALPILLGITAYFNENSFLEPTVLTGFTKDLNFSINLALGIFTSVLVILFVIKRKNRLCYV